MKLKLSLALISAVLVVPTLWAQQPAGQAQPPAGQTPAGQPQRPRSQLPELGRPTKGDDQVPPFNFDEYFAGKWKFEWDVPAGPMGEAGQITGTTTYKKVSDGFWEAVTEGQGPDGPIKMTELIAFPKDAKTVSRYVTDGRGFSYMQTGPIGGDMGGYWSIYYDSAPFKYNGHTMRMKTAMRLLSPVNYKVTVTVSVDGGPFRSYGNPWWQKDMTAK